MGTGHSYRCKCRKTNKHINVGIGMMYPRVCDRNKENMLAGEYGDAWKRFLEEHPGGAFDGERLVYKCSACEYWELDYKKDYYMTVTGEPAEHNYVMWFDRYFRKYRCVRRFRHMCPECDKPMHIANLKKERLLCKECKAPMKFALDTINWD